jgi:hypothetical protein
MDIDMDIRNLDVGSDIRHTVGLRPLQSDIRSSDIRSSDIRLNLISFTDKGLIIHL